MPSNIIPAAPVGVLPKLLCQMFTEELLLEAMVNYYPDGSSERLALALNPRRLFRLRAALRGAAWSQLWAFYQAHLGVPFYFYNLRETVPPWTYDPAGAATAGRYVVVFDAGWSEDNVLPRAAVGFVLREVA